MIICSCFNCYISSHTEWWSAVVSTAIYWAILNDVCSCFNYYVSSRTEWWSAVVSTALYRAVLNDDLQLFQLLYIEPYWMLICRCFNFHISSRTEWWSAVVSTAIYRAILNDDMQLFQLLYIEPWSHFMSLVSFYTPWKHQKMYSFLFLGWWLKDQWHKMSKTRM